MDAVNDDDARDGDDAGVDAEVENPAARSLLMPCTPSLMPSNTALLGSLALIGAE